MLSQEIFAASGFKSLFFLFMPYADDTLLIASDEADGIF